MSKLSFRARQVDYTKPLPIYLNHDLPDLQDFAAINRSVPQMPTGMEKDEEAVSPLRYETGKRKIFRNYWGFFRDRNLLNRENRGIFLDFQKRGN